MRRGWVEGVVGERGEMSELEKEKGGDGWNRAAVQSQTRLH